MSEKQMSIDESGLSLFREILAEAEEFARQNTDLEIGVDSDKLWEWVDYCENLNALMYQDGVTDDEWKRAESFLNGKFGIPSTKEQREERDRKIMDDMDRLAAITRPNPN